MKVDKAGIDILLVGDSAGMVVHGHDTTVPVTLEMMLLHCQAVSRGASRPFLIGDMPFGSYEISKGQAVSTAMQFLKQGNVDAVKVEGEPHGITVNSNHPMSPQSPRNGVTFFIYPLYHAHCTL